MIGYKRPSLYVVRTDKSTGQERQFPVQDVSEEVIRASRQSESSLETTARTESMARVTGRAVGRLGYDLWRCIPVKKLTFPAAAVVGASSLLGSSPAYPLEEYVMAGMVATGTVAIVEYTLQKASPYISAAYRTTGLVVRTMLDHIAKKK